MNIHSKEGSLCRRPPCKLATGTLAFVGVVFGLATFVAGARVLAGADPGYLAFRPLMIFNTAMGVACLPAGTVVWRSPERGKVMAAAIFLLNLVVLAAVAVDSVRAMVFRTGIWLVLLLGVLWLARPRGADGDLAIRMTGDTAT